MKKLLSICAALAMVLTAATALASDLTGTWNALAQMPNGDAFQLTYTFKQDGATVTGNVQGPQGDPIAISSGKVDGDKITFDVTFNGTVIHHSGTITGDEIKLTSKADSGDFPGMEILLKRAKDAAPPAAAPAPPASTPVPPANPPVAK
jgi:lipopolysaccharide export system protein LptA